MRIPTKPGVRALIPATVYVVGIAGLAGCRTPACVEPSELAMRAAIERYAAAQTDRLAVQPEVSPARPRGGDAPALRWAYHRAAGGDQRYVTLGTLNEAPPVPTTGPPRTATTQSAAPPTGYWRADIWHQMGHEALALGKHDFWHGFKTSFWDLENELVLTATMGASVALRGTGVDDTIRNRTHGSRALGDMDETIQILGHPGTHFAAAGALWLGSALTKDMKEHEIARALTEALAVNGVTTVLLKASTNTRTPDGEHFGWPSGHTSSAFAAAAVLHEYYGPLVGVPSLALAGLVGYQRLDSRVHDFSDVVFGAMLGYVIGSSIAKDEKAHFPELFGMQVIPYADPDTGAAGLALLKRW